MPSSNPAAPGNAQHHEGERSAGHGFGIEVPQCLDVRGRKVRVHRPHRVADFSDQTLRTGARTANREGQIAVYLFRVAIHQNGPVHHARNIRSHAVIMYGGGDPNNFSPLIL